MALGRRGRSAGEGSGKGTRERERNARRKGTEEGGRLAKEMGGWQVICWALVLSTLPAVPLFFGGGIPGDITEFEPLFQVLRNGFVDEGRKAISSYASWKEGALGGFAKGNAQVQALKRDERKATD